MAETQHSITAPSALAKLFDERLASYTFARDRMEGQPDDTAADDANHFANAYLYSEELMLGTPASGLSDLRAKAEILWGDPTNNPERRDIMPLLADLVRLTGREASRVFDPQQWLRRFEHAGGMWLVREDGVLILEPVDRDLSDLIDMLRAMDGAEAVKALIRRKHAPGPLQGPACAHAAEAV